MLAGKFPGIRVEAVPMRRTVKLILLLAAMIAIGTAACGEVTARVGTCVTGFRGTWERGVGTGPYWRGEPSDCRSIWRHGHYRGNDPDQNIRLQLMRAR
jgi:hypothetical protein